MAQIKIEAEALPFKKGIYAPLSFSDRDQRLRL